MDQGSGLLFSSEQRGATVRTLESGCRRCPDACRALAGGRHRGADSESARARSARVPAATSTTGQPSLSRPCLRQAYLNLQYAAPVPLPATVVVKAELQRREGRKVRCKS